MVKTKHSRNKINNEETVEKKEELKPTNKIYKCVRCGKSSNSDRFAFYSNSELFKSNGQRLSICKSCFNELYEMYLNDIFDGDIYLTIKTLCCMFDIYYSPKVVESVKLSSEKSIPTGYIKFINTPAFCCTDKTYKNTLAEEHTNKVFGGNPLKIISKDGDSETQRGVEKFFGEGFSDRDYEFLQREYNDWVTRHECTSKTQEELFKRLAFKQLEIYKASIQGNSTKDLDKTFADLLNVSNLQPKQSSSEAFAETQTFGTLLQKWENTRPLPEIDEELKDVDKIGLYIDVFFKGHLAKMMGIKGFLSDVYTKFIKKYTVTKPEYEEDEDVETTFNNYFGDLESMDSDE